MAQFTASYSAFKSRLAEVSALRTMATEKERADPIRKRSEINALCRGAIVLLSSHVESYVRDVGELALESLFAKRIDRSALVPRMFYHISKDLIDEIKDTVDHDGIANKIFGLLNDDGPFWSKTGPFLAEIPAARFNKGFSNPTFDKVSSYFNRFGYIDFKRDFRRTLGAQAVITENMLNQLVKTRNDIAHGDYTVTKTPADLADMARIISVCCRTTDKVFADWWKSNHCPIR